MIDPGEAQVFDGVSDDVRDCAPLGFGRGQRPGADRIEEGAKPAGIGRLFVFVHKGRGRNRRVREPDRRSARIVRAPVRERLIL